MMMVYGMFVFTLRTIPYQQLQQSQEWRHVKNERVNQSAGWQYIGPGDDTITLSGVLYPEITGGNLSLAALRTIGFTGRPWPLIEGDGRIYGMYVLARLEEGRTEFDRYGNAKKIEFTLTLNRADSDFREKLQSSSVGDVLSDLRSSATKAVNSVSDSLNSLF
ncbi:phage tail protein [Klebsiella pneumoniae]|uniref:phage tail protein n=1 Tax=Klebsiella/Raoultella group TaxID=2890311 RepID=UPI000C9AAE0F|nr:MULTISPECIES: phage tail protein [Klebsiella/Raoultella group]EIW9279102.1 phage tail protein [Klebsiella pneumoniae]EIX9753943.1 phage tail protein [Klebsiella pneumoniae]MCM5920254.1 phage tail protein [Klebsiella pneumoniae]MCP6410614.1 phage tail protein [Klebsiella pneumoniae]MCU8621296.1 phage tail protein [Klebsiella pneumoniae]